MVFLKIGDLLQRFIVIKCHKPSISWWYMAVLLTLLHHVTPSCACWGPLSKVHLFRGTADAEYGIADRRVFLRADDVPCSYPGEMDPPTPNSTHQPTKQRGFTVVLDTQQLRIANCVRNSNLLSRCHGEVTQIMRLAGSGVHPCPCLVVNLSIPMSHQKRSSFWANVGQWDTYFFGSTALLVNRHGWVDCYRWGSIECVL